MEQLTSGRHYAARLLSQLEIRIIKSVSYRICKGRLTQDPVLKVVTSEWYVTSFQSICCRSYSPCMYDSLCRTAVQQLILLQGSQSTYLLGVTQ